MGIDRGRVGEQFGGHRNRLQDRGQARDGVVSLLPQPWDCVSEGGNCLGRVRRRRGLDPLGLLFALLPLSPCPYPLGVSLVLALPPTLTRSAIATPQLVSIYQKFLGATYDDMRRMDVALWESTTLWTAIRAPRIQAAASKGRYRLGIDGPLKRGWLITAADMATALLDIADRDDLNRRYVYVAN